jgi:hypothetical protein
LLKDSHGRERMIHRLLPDHQTETGQVAADHVVKSTMAGMAFDVLEQQRRAALAAHQIGDGRRFEVGIDFGRDALELAERLDLFQPGIEVARIGTAGTLSAFGFRGLSFVPGRANPDVHVHVRLPFPGRSAKLSAAAGWVHTARRTGGRANALARVRMRGLASGKQKPGTAAGLGLARAARTRIRGLPLRSRDPADGRAT